MHRDKCISKGATLTEILSVLACRCNDHSKLDQEHHQRNPRSRQRRVTCIANQAVEPLFIPSWEITWNPWKHCLRVAQLWSRAGWSLLGSWEPGEMAYVCVHLVSLVMRSHSFNSVPAEIHHVLSVGLCLCNAARWLYGFITYYRNCSTKQLRLLLKDFMKRERMRWL